MAVLHRALVTWFLSVIFLILIVIRLEPKSSFSWFIAFIPMWIFDGSVLTYSVFFMINRCKSIRNHRRSNNIPPLSIKDYCTVIFKQKIYTLVAIVLKLTFEIMLCIRLEVPSLYLPLYYVFFPMWILLGAAIIKLFQVLISMCQEPDEPLPTNDARAQLVANQARRQSSGFTGATTRNSSGGSNSGPIIVGAGTSITARAACTTRQSHTSS